MNHVGYIRVSSVDQNTGRQLEGLSVDKIFTDKTSGKDTNRPALQACLEYLRDGDHLHVHSIDRLGRSLSDLTRLVEELTSRGVTVSFEKEHLTFLAGARDVDPMARLQFHMLAAFAQFERALIRERQREGIALAKQAGKYKGRAPRATKELAAQARELLRTMPHKADVARALGVSRATLYKALAAFPATPASDGS